MDTITAIGLLVIAMLFGGMFAYLLGVIFPLDK